MASHCQISFHLYFEYVVCFKRKHIVATSSLNFSPQLCKTCLAYERKYLVLHRCFSFLVLFRGYALPLNTNFGDSLNFPPFLYSRHTLPINTTFWYFIIKSHFKFYFGDMLSLQKQSVATSPLSLVVTKHE